MRTRDSIGLFFNSHEPAQATGWLPHLGLTINSITTTNGGWNTDQDTGITDGVHILWLWREADGARTLHIAFGASAVADPPAHYQRVASGAAAEEDSPVLGFFVNPDRRHFRIESPSAITIWKWCTERIH